MKNSKKITYTALLIAIGIALPQALHLLGGPTAGSIFLPIQLPIFICGVILGFSSTALMAVTLPVISFLLTSMPSAIKLPFMIIELILYAIFLKLFDREGIPLLVRIALTQICGRVALLLVYIVLSLLSVSGALTFTLAIDTFIIALPGIIIQLLIVPIFVKLKRGN